MPLHGDRLRYIRESKGWSQAKLSRLCGLGEKQVWRYENAQGDPTSAHLVKIARTLNCSADYLLGLVEEPGGHFAGRNLSPLEENWLLALERQDSRSVVKLYHQRGAELMYEKLAKVSDEDATIPLPELKQ